MSLTERILEIVECARKFRLPDDEADQMLYRIGCTRVVRRSGTVIVYYLDGVEERFVICARS